jgi:hypothetical protein
MGLSTLRDSESLGSQDSKIKLFQIVKLEIIMDDDRKIQLKMKIKDCFEEGYLNSSGTNQTILLDPKALMEALIEIVESL